MPITVAWHDEQQTCMLITFKYQWSLEDFHRMVSETDDMGRSTHHPFVTLADLSRSALPPIGLVHIRNRLQHMPNPYHAGLVVVNSMPIITKIAKMFTITLKLSTRFTTSLDEALIEVDNLLANFQPDIKNSKRK